MLSGILGVIILVADNDSAVDAGLTPRARLLDWEVVGVPPRIMGCGPVPAIEVKWY